MKAYLFVEIDSMEHWRLETELPSLIPIGYTIDCLGAYCSRYFEFRVDKAVFGKMTLPLAEKYKDEKDFLVLTYKPKFSIFKKKREKQKMLIRRSLTMYGKEKWIQQLQRR